LLERIQVFISTYKKEGIMKIHKWFPAATLVLILLTACGGGSSSNPNSLESNNDTNQNPINDTGQNPATDTGQNPAPTGSGTAVVLAANDLGMHCIDREFSVFSILPPFNVIHAQVLNRNASGLPELLDQTQANVRYDATVDANGSINSYSATGPLTKTDFWDWADSLFGTSLTTGEGLTGLYMPGDDPLNRGPQPMTYDSAAQWFAAEGIPLTPINDNGQTNPFGLMRISAQDTNGQQIGYQDIVVPVAAETDCQACHKTGGIAAQGSGWSSAQDLEVQSKINILRLHDQEHHTSLEASQPVLCAQCHYSLALDLAGTGPTATQAGQPTFSRAIHAFHGGLKDSQGQPIFTGTIDGNCYQCHPGKTTQCLRGAMAAGGVDCFDCHGDLASVGGEHPLLAGGSLDGTNDGNPRRPWLDLPRCQSCHTGDAASYLNTGTGLMRDATWPFRLVQAYRTSDLSASPVAAPTSRFAENTNTLYRLSKGHGGIFCEGCHGSTHAIWPNADPNANDNAAAIALQGYAGVIKDCTVCHPAGSLPLTTDGPHGLHNIADSRWYSEDGHGERYERNKNACKACHGTDLNGTPLSKVSVARSLRVEGRTVNFAAGDRVGCTHCHGRPSL
jgi:hypothetical protein